MARVAGIRNVFDRFYPDIFCLRRIYTTTREYVVWLRESRIDPVIFVAVVVVVLTIGDKVCAWTIRVSIWDG